MKTTDELFSRSVAKFVDPDNIFVKKIEAKICGEYKKDIIIKFGCDPTRPDLHLGHAVILRKLREFQDLGCKVVFLVGDYTTQIGDPTGRSKVRPEISQAEIEKNMQTYIDQVGKILKTDSESFSWVRNSDWFTNITDISVSQGATVTVSDKLNQNKVIVDGNSFVGKAAIFENTRMQKTNLHKKEVRTVSFSRVLAILRHITHSRLIERDMFQDRIAKKEELYMHEMMYPVIQGIDSSVIASIYDSCDLEIGGTDQLFNMLVGRDVMRISNQSEQSVIALEILEGLDGKEKMSKSLDNYIAITDEPNDMYGKIMSLPDLLITRYFTLATYTPTSDIVDMKSKIENGDVNPRDFKMRLAREIVAIYNGEEAAQNAEDHFVDTFSKGKIPEDVKEFQHLDGDNIIDFLVKSEIASSKTEAKRLIENGAVTHLESNEKVTNIHALPAKGTYRVGKHKFFKIV